MQRVYHNQFYKATTAWHAPLVRWAVGSDTALSGPMLVKINLSAELNAAAHTYNPDGFDEAQPDGIKAWSSGFQAIARARLPLLTSRKITMTNAITHFEPSSGLIRLAEHT